MNEGEIRRLVDPTAKESEKGLVAPEYLIDNVDSSNYLIHRELKTEEVNNYAENKVFEYEGKTYLFAILNMPSEEDAERVIHGFWKAFQGLNQLEL